MYLHGSHTEPHVRKNPLYSVLIYGTRVVGLQRYFLYTEDERKKITASYNYTTTSRFWIKLNAEEEDFIRKLNRMTSLT